MATWAFAPSYDIVLDKRNPKAGQRGQPARLAYQLRTLVELQALLVTGNGVGNATLSFWDPRGILMEQVDPQPLDVIQVRLTNRHGTWATAWTGYVDEVHEIHDPAQGRLLTIKASSPYVLWEVGRQSGGDVIALAVASMQNVAGSEVVAYSARAVGYNPAHITFDPVADSGTGLMGSISAGNYSDPAQQTWSAVVQQVLGSSGLEFFFNEEGYGHYRRMGFLGTSQRRIPRIPLEEMLHADLGRAHRELVTSVEVRWGLLPATQNAAKKAAPTGMVTHLGTRPLVIHAPWLLSKLAADYLATTLLDQYAAGAATASIIVIADAATYRVGTVVEVPGIRTGQGHTRYYISSVTYLCQWGGQWIQTLGLTFGRAPGNVFPYLGNVAYPILTASPKDLPALVPLLAFDVTNASKVTSPLTVVAQSSLATNQVSSSSLPVGSLIELRTSVSGGGQWVGPSHQYVVVAAPPGQDPLTIGLKSGSGTAYATIVQYGSGDAGYTTTTSTGMTSNAPGNTLPSGPPTLPVRGPNTKPPGTGGHPFGKVPPSSLKNPRGIAQRALAAAHGLAGQPYVSGHAGSDGWDCSGLVAFAYMGAGNAFGTFIPNYWGPGLNGDTGPQGIYHALLAAGAKQRAFVGDAQAGDILFIKEPGLVYNTDGTPGYPNNQEGFSHVAFCDGPNQNFGANSIKMGICASAIQGYKGAYTTTFNIALDCSTLPG